MSKKGYTRNSLFSDLCEPHGIGLRAMRIRDLRNKKNKELIENRRKLYLEVETLLDARRTTEMKKKIREDYFRSR